MKREYSSRVYFNKSEMNNATEKVKELKFNNIPELVRFAIQALDADLAAEILELKERVKKLCVSHNDMLTERDAAKTQMQIHEHNAKYWENYGTRALEEKAELEEELAERHDQVSAQLQVIERDTNRLETFKKALDRVHVPDTYGTLDERLLVTLNCYEELHETIKDLEGQRDQFEKLYHEETSVYNKCLDRNANLKRTQQKFFKGVLTKLGLEASESHSLIDVEKAVGKILAMKKAVEDEKNLLYGICINFLDMSKERGHYPKDVEVAFATHFAKVEGQAESWKEQIRNHAQQLNQAREQRDAAKRDYNQLTGKFETCQAQMISYKDDLSKAETNLADGRVAYHSLSWNYQCKPLYKIWWERMKRRFSKDTAEKRKGSAKG